MSNRLQTLADLVRPGFPLWDICCDHGYLGLSLLKNKTISELFLIDESKKVIDTLIENLKSQSFYHSAIFQENSATLFSPLQTTQVRNQSGEDIDVCELSGTIVIAGVGSYTVIKMLENWGNKKFWLNKNDRLIICAHKNVDHLRLWLHNKPFHFHSEILIKEKNRFREVIVLEQKQDDLQQSTPVPIIGQFNDSPFRDEYFQLIQNLKSLKL